MKASQRAAKVEGRQAEEEERLVEKKTANVILHSLHGVEGRRGAGGEGGKERVQGWEGWRVTREKV